MDRPYKNFTTPYLMDRLYKNIFADRGPNKRKVKPKAIDDMDLNEESSEDEEFGKQCGGK